MKGLSTGGYGWSSLPDREAAQRTLEVFLEEAAASGCDAVEHLAPGLGELLPRYRLRLSGCYASGPLHLPWAECGAERSILPAARECAELGGEDLVVNCDPKGSWANRQRKTADELRQQGENLTRLAELVAPLGLQVAMHKHAASAPLHLDDLDAVTAYAGPQVGVCLDTGWALTSEDDPVARIRALGPRLTALHLRNQYGAVPCEWHGEGDIDFTDLFAALREVDYRGWLTSEIYFPAATRRTLSLAANMARSNALLRELWTGGAA
ncbi:MAG: sugar phosphate isomerase/epimerase [Fimbriimonadaceae bacterium]|nr:sugar phosphate isomerase/epimerase [Fimbriimonadaceae bacterium]